MKRDELINFAKGLRSWGICIPSDILECSIDEYLKSISPKKSMSKGAELKDFLRHNQISDFDFAYTGGFDNMIELLGQFINQKEEGLREELITYRRWENVFFTGMEDITRMVDMYLKIRDSQ